MCCKDKDYLTKKQESAVQKCVFAYFLYRFNQKLRFDHFGGDSITTLQRVDLSLGIVAHGPDGEVGRIVGVERLKPSSSAFFPHDANIVAANARMISFFITLNV